MFINLDKLNQYRLLIKTDIDEYETAIYEVLSDIKNTYYFWNDGYTQNYFTNIGDEIQDAGSMLSCLDDIVKFLDNMYSTYYSIYMEQNDLVNSDNLVVDTDYLSISESDDDSVKEEKQRLIHMIEDAEDDIEFSITKLGNLLIQNKYFDNLDISDASDMNFIGMKNEMKQKISEILSMYEKFGTYNDKLMNDLDGINGWYNSKNTKKIIKRINNVINSIYIINNNIGSAINYMVHRKNEIYKKLVEEYMTVAYNIEKA